MKIVVTRKVSRSLIVMNLPSITPKPGVNRLFPQASFKVSDLLSSFSNNWGTKPIFSWAFSLVFICAFIGFKLHAQDDSPAAGGSTTPSVPIVVVVPDLNHLQKWDDSAGDTSDPFWADDDNLYSFICDGRGFGKESRNFCFNRLSGPDLSDLTGSIINTMADYGTSSSKGPDGATWKVTGQECIDNVLYAFVNRNVYGNLSGDSLMRQTSFHASLIKSTDKGLTWERSAKENYYTPMWPDRRFGAPGFIHFGKNGGQVVQDDADNFVYAISNNGFWDDGDSFVLARVLRADLPKLQPSDWSYYINGDGLSDSAWSHDLGKAKPILSSPAKLSWTAPAYIPALRRYLLVSWYTSERLTKWFEPKRMTYEFYQAKHPWGPWTQVSSFNDEFLSGSHMYGANLCAKYQKQIGGDVRIQLFTSGCPFKDEPTGLYKMWRIPLLLKTKPLPEVSVVNDNDPAIRYSGNWLVSSNRNLNDTEDDVHYSRTPGDAVDFTFTGTGIALLSEKYRDEGSIEILLDGQSRGIASLNVSDFPRLSKIPVFEADGLIEGKHRVRIVNISSKVAIIDAFVVTH